MKKDNWIRNFFIFCFLCKLNVKLKVWTFFILYEAAHTILANALIVSDWKQYTFIDVYTLSIGIAEVWVRPLFCSALPATCQKIVDAGIVPVVILLLASTFDIRKEASAVHFCVRPSFFFNGASETNTWQIWWLIKWLNILDRWLKSFHCRQPSVCAILPRTESISVESWWSEEHSRGPRHCSRSPNRKTHIWRSASSTWFFKLHQRWAPSLIYSECAAVPCLERTICCCFEI